MALIRLKTRGLKKLLNKLKATTRNDVIRRSLNQGAFHLLAWSKKNRLSGRPGLKVQTGRLRSSITVNTAEKSGKTWRARIGTNVVYGRIHEFGGVAGRNQSVTN